MQTSEEKMKMPIHVSSRKEHQKALLKLLKAFAAVCEQHNIPYMLYAGTMLGAVRHHGFIPWDDDVDVIMARPAYERFLAIAPTALDQNTFFLQSEYSKHWPMFFSKLRLNNTACMEKYVPKDLEMHQGVYIDIFPFDNLSDNRLERKLQFLASKLVIANGLQKRGYSTKSILKKMVMTFSCILPIQALHEYVMKRGQKNSRYVHTFFAAASSYSKNVFPREWFEKYIGAVFEQGQYPISAFYRDLLTTIYGDYMTLPSLEERECKEHNFFVDTANSYTNYIGYQNGKPITVNYKSIR